MNTIKEDSFEYVLLFTLAVIVATAETIIKNCAVMLRGLKTSVTVTTEQTNDIPLGEEEDKEMDVEQSIIEADMLQLEKELPALSEHLTFNEQLNETRRFFLMRTYTTKELKYFLGEMGQKKTGKKLDLVLRVIDYLNNEMIPSGCGWITLKNHLNQCK